VEEADNLLFGRGALVVAPVDPKAKIPSGGSTGNYIPILL
jgi:hypothetical protein